MSYPGQRCFVSIALALLLGCGDSNPKDTSMLRSGFSGSEFTATVETPEGEPASVGSYRGSITYPDGRIFEISGARDGSLSGKWLVDLGGNEFPELIIWMTGAGSGSYASVHIYWMTANGPEFEDASAIPVPATGGYMGHDSLAVSDQKLRRCFPLYLNGDTNAEPSGSERCLVYTSMMGWVIE